MKKISISFLQSLDESYLGYIMGDFMDLGLGIRRSSLPEPEPPDLSTLQRAVSFESVCSDTSVTLVDLDEAPIVGHVCVGLEHERWSGRGEGEGDLIVSVLEARDLVAADGQPAQDTFARYDHKKISNFIYYLLCFTLCLEF